MPRTRMEPVRREALVRATIAEIGKAGSLDVTVSRIARRAGMSSALAHHYFGSKDQIFLAAMQRILSDFGAEVRAELAICPPTDRAAAIIRACFAPSSFAKETISAWMTFYVLAQNNTQALRLWRIYQRRLTSNLTHALRGLTDNPKGVSETLVALIDGLYIRAALGAPETPDAAAEHALSVLNTLRRRPV